MKKLNSETLAQKFNSLRIAYKNSSFSTKEMTELLRKNGFNYKLFTLMSRSNSFFLKTKKGVCVFYRFPDSPVYKGNFSTILQELRTSPKKKEFHFSESEAIALLKSRGYIITKNLGIDESSLKQNYPQIYKECLIIKTY